MNVIVRILQRAFEYAVFYLALLLFGMQSLGWSVFAVLLKPVLPEAAGSRLGRRIIMAIFRVFLTFLATSGRFRFDLTALDRLRDEKSLIIAPNHPAFWDAMMIVSRLPDAVCVMKSDVMKNIFLGAGARLARYIPNEPARQMIHQAVRELQRGSHLLLFPEGTRTVRRPINPLRGSIGLVASRARACVQTVIIETDSPFLQKGWPIYKVPRLPMTIRVRLGRRFDPPVGSSAAFVAELENYFLRELAAPASMPDEAISLPRTGTAN